jgi:murein DD-endopeptidase MepM/ murein hydrolase activator NlpD
MSKENPSIKKVSAFFEGKGFYLVLFLCVAAIGVSGLMMNAEKKAEEEQLRLEQQMEGYMGEPGESQVVENKELTIPATPEEKLIEFKPGETPAKTADTAAASGKTGKVTAKETVFVNPVAGEVVNAFSAGELVYDATFDDWRTHNGTDFTAQPGERVMSIADGKVESIAHDEMYGTVVTINHGDGIKATYYNLMPNVLVKEGDNVAVNEVIGGLGSEALFENHEEPHLHIEVTKSGKAINPAEILPD